MDQNTRDRHSWVRRCIKIGEQLVRLPHEEFSDNMKDNDERAVKQESKEPILAAEQSILDHG